MARFASSRTTSADPVEAAELAALDRIREILYSSERDHGMPPSGMYQAINESGSRKRLALDLILEALKSEVPKAQHRAAASLQFFKEWTDEVMAETVALFKDSTDQALIAYAASTCLLKPGPEMIPVILEAYKNNPAAASGVQSWLGMYLFRNKTDDSVIVQHLAPFLDSENSDARWNAAWILSRTSAKNDPRILAALVSVLEAANFRNEGLSFDALAALKRIGPGARSAADAIRAYGERVPQMRESVIDALATIAPDLRTEIPELDTKFKAIEQAAALEERAKKNEASVASLIEGLTNEDGRIRTVKRLGDLGRHAVEALPKLREILKAGDSDAHPDAGNFLFAVATTIRQLDPTAPTYYRSEDLQTAFMDALDHLKAAQDEGAKAVRSDVERRMFSPRPVDRNEIAAWANRLKAADLDLGESFVRNLKRSGPFSQLETSDPELAKALAQ